MALRCFLRDQIYAKCCVYVWAFSRAALSWLGLGIGMSIVNGLICLLPLMLGLILVYLRCSDARRLC